MTGTATVTEGEMLGGAPRTSAAGLRPDLATSPTAAMRARVSREPGQARLLSAGVAELLIVAALSLVIAVLVLLGGYMIAQAEAHERLQPVTVIPIMATEIDPRDAVVANGFVTPWMERLNTPDPP